MDTIDGPSDGLSQKRTKDLAHKKKKEICGEKDFWGSFPRTDQTSEEIGLGGIIHRGKMSENTKSGKTLIRN